MRKKISIILAISFIFTLLSTNIALSETGGAAIEIVDSDGDVGRYTSIALDSNGNPHISYFDYTNGDLKYAYYDGSVWTSSTVDSDGDVGRYTSIALDNNGNPHISYYDSSPNNDLKYAYYDGSVWTSSTVDSDGDVGRYTSIALDNNGNPHISYYDSSPNNDLKYAYYDGTTWQSITVDNNRYVGKYTSIALDNNGNPYISYYDNYNGDLKYTYKDGTTWQSITVDSDGDIGYYTSLVIDGNRNLHISYIDGFPNSDLKYAYYDGSVWTSSTVDSDGIGEYTFIALDSNGNPHISYFDGSNTDLKYAYYDGSVWTSSTVDSDGHVGYDTSLAIDSYGNSHISYYTFTNYGLKYAFLSPSISTNINIGTIKEGLINEETLEITNDGFLGLKINNIVSSSQTLVVEDIVGETIYPGETKEVQILISTTEIGRYNETIEIYSNDPDMVTVEVSGLVESWISNAHLNSLSITGIELDKNFDSDVSVYEIVSSSDLNNIEITIETVNPLSTININNEISTGTTTKTVTLDNGENLIPIVVTSQDGTTERAYILSVNGTVSDADLLDLEVNGSSVSGFNKDTESYTINVNNDVENIDISASPSNDKALILINNTIYQGGNKTIDLEVGENIIEVMVVAQDSTTKTYALAVNRETANTDLSGIALDNGTLNEAFDPFTYSYTAVVNNTVDSITITPTTEDSNATVKVNNTDISTPVDLEVGENIATIEVTGVDGVSKKTYEIIIIRREALEVTNNSLPIGIVGGSYNAELSAEGGKAPYTWSATGLPDGLNISPTTGEITGTPITEGEYTVNIKVVDDAGIKSTKALNIKINLGCGNGGYIITTDNDPTYTSSFTNEGIFMMTVNEDVTGFKYFSVLIESVTGHDDKEVVIFIHLRNGKQISINATRADFDLGFTAEAAFNVQSGDVIKVFIVDELSNDINHSPSIL